MLLEDFGWYDSLLSLPLEYLLVLYYYIDIKMLTLQMERSSLALLLEAFAKGGQDDCFGRWREAFQIKYLVEKIGLSGGWRGFSIAHKLLEGDVCVFHLVKPSKFKVTVWAVLCIAYLTFYLILLLWPPVLDCFYESIWWNGRKIQRTKKHSICFLWSQICISTDCYSCRVDFLIIWLNF